MSSANAASSSPKAEAKLVLEEADEVCREWVLFVELRLPSACPSAAIHHLFISCSSMHGCLIHVLERAAAHLAAIKPYNSLTSAIAITRREKGCQDGMCPLSGQFVTSEITNFKVLVHLFKYARWARLQAPI